MGRHKAQAAYYLYSRSTQVRTRRTPWFRFRFTSHTTHKANHTRTRHALAWFPSPVKVACLHCTLYQARSVCENHRHHLTDSPIPEHVSTWLRFTGFTSFTHPNNISFKRDKYNLHINITKFHIADETAILYSEQIHYLNLLVYRWFNSFFMKYRTTFFIDCIRVLC